MYNSINTYMEICMLPLFTIAPKLHTTQMSFTRMADKYIVATHPVGTQQSEEIDHCHMQQRP